MSRKLVLAPVILEPNKSLAANFITAPTIIDFQDNIAYQINIITSNSTGTFTVQASLDYDQRLGTGNFADLTLNAIPTVAAANDTFLINLNQLPFRAIRLSYSSTIAGTGTCKIIIMAKVVGA
jgi:hypothetical protein